MPFQLKHYKPSAEACEDGYTFEPVYPDGAGIGATITVRGPESRAVRELINKRNVEAADRAKRRDIAPLTLAQRDAQLVEEAIVCTVRWDGFIDGDAPLDATPENMRRIYGVAPWLCVQIVSKAGDLANFVHVRPEAL